MYFLESFWVEKNSFWVKAGEDVGWGSGGSACLGESPEWFEEVDFLFPSSRKNLGEESQVLKDSTNLTLYFLNARYVYSSCFWGGHDKDPGSVFTDQLVSTHDKGSSSFGETELTPQNITGQIVHHVPYVAYQKGCDFHELGFRSKC